MENVVFLRQIGNVNKMIRNWRSVYRILAQVLAGTYVKSTIRLPRVRRNNFAVKLICQLHSD